MLGVVQDDILSPDHAHAVEAFPRFHVNGILGHPIALIVATHTTTRMTFESQSMVKK